MSLSWERGSTLFTPFKWWFVLYIMLLFTFWYYADENETVVIARTSWGTQFSFRTFDPDANELRVLFLADIGMHSKASIDCVKCARACIHPCLVCVCVCACRVRARAVRSCVRVSCAWVQRAACVQPSNFYVLCCCLCLCSSFYCRRTSNTDLFPFKVHSKNLWKRLVSCHAS